MRRETLLGRMLRAPLRLIPRSAVVPVLQGPARGAHWVVGSGTHGCWLGSYERVKAEAFAGALLPGMCVYDIGANVGYYTLLAAMRLRGSGSVLAFEPLPENLAYLRRHIQLNRLCNVRTIEAAVSDRAGQATFARGADRSSGRIADTGTLHVRTVALDQLRAVEQLHAPDIMKIDVEGAEFAVLCGAERLLRENPPLIFLATHGADVHAACCGLLRDCGYELTSLDGRPVDQTDELIARPPRPRSGPI